MLLELTRPIYMNTELGNGYAYLAMDNGPHTDLLWGVFLEDTGRIVFIPNPKIRVATNFSEGITSEKIELKKAPWE